MLLKAGTYRFNDVLPELIFEQSIDITTTAEDNGTIATVKISKLAGMQGDNFALVGLFYSIVIEGEEQLNEETPMAVYGGAQKDYWHLPLQTHTITKDVEVADDFGAWYKANTDYNEVNGITITWDGQIEGREAITISSDGTIETAGHLIGEIELDDINSLIGATFEVYADSSKGEISYIGSPITDIIKVFEGVYQFGSFNLSTDDVTTGYQYIFTYAIKGVYSWEIVEGVVATVTVPKTGIYSEVQQAQTEPTYIPYVYPSKLTIPVLPTKTKKFTRLYLGEVAYSSNGKRFRKLQTEEDTEEETPPASEGLEFTSNGDGTCYVSGIGTCTDTDIIIPSVSPEGDVVTRIGLYAFDNCSQLTNVKIPDSVTSIGGSAFYSCDSLQSLVIPDSVTSVGGEFLAYCDLLTSVTLGNSVTFDGNSSFAYCKNLTTINIPDSVTCIRAFTFSHCEALPSIVIPSGVTEIRNYGLAFCYALNNITFNGTVAQWNAIALGENWNSKVPATYVQCTDGQVTL